MTEPIPSPTRRRPARPCAGDHHGRWVKIPIDWCLSRTPTSLERRDGGYWYILGTERAAAANALPGQLLDEIDASPDPYAPTDAALVAMLDAGIRRIGHRWDPATESVQLTNPIRALRVPSMPIIHLFDTDDSYDDADELWDDDCRIGLPFVEVVDCDWRIEDEFSPEGRLSLYAGKLPSIETDIDAADLSALARAEAAGRRTRRRPRADDHSDRDGDHRRPAATEPLEHQAAGSADPRTQRRAGEDGDLRRLGLPGHHRPAAHPHRHRHRTRHLPRPNADNPRPTPTRHTSREQAASG
jgi:hypothetical protein